MPAKPQYDAHDIHRYIEYRKAIALDEIREGKRTFPQDNTLYIPDPSSEERPVGLGVVGRGIASLLAGKQTTGQMLVPLKTPSYRRSRQPLGLPYDLTSIPNIIRNIPSDALVPIELATGRKYRPDTALKIASDVISSKIIQYPLHWSVDRAITRLMTIAYSIPELKFEATRQEALSNIWNAIQGYIPGFKLSEVETQAGKDSDFGEWVRRALNARNPGAGDEWADANPGWYALLKMTSPGPGALAGKFGIIEKATAKGLKGINRVKYLRHQLKAARAGKMARYEKNFEVFLNTVDDLRARSGTPGRMSPDVVRKAHPVEVERLRNYIKDAFPKHTDETLASSDRVRKIADAEYNRFVHPSGVSIIHFPIGPFFDTAARTGIRKWLIKNPHSTAARVLENVFSDFYRIGGISARGIDILGYSTSGKYLQNISKLWSNIVLNPLLRTSVRNIRQLTGTELGRYAYRVSKVAEALPNMAPEVKSSVIDYLKEDSKLTEADITKVLEETPSLANAVVNVKGHLDGDILDALKLSSFNLSEADNLALYQALQSNDPSSLTGEVRSHYDTVKDIMQEYGNKALEEGFINDLEESYGVPVLLNDVSRKAWLRKNAEGIRAALARKGAPFTRQNKRHIKQLLKLTQGNNAFDIETLSKVLGMSPTEYVPFERSILRELARNKYPDDPAAVWKLVKDMGVDNFNVDVPNLVHKWLVAFGAQRKVKPFIIHQLATYQPEEIDSLARHRAKTVKEPTAFADNMDLIINGWTLQEKAQFVLDGFTSMGPFRDFIDDKILDLLRSKEQAATTAALEAAKRVKEAAAKEIPAPKEKITVEEPLVTRKGPDTGYIGGLYDVRINEDVNMKKLGIELDTLESRINKGTFNIDHLDTTELSKAGHVGYAAIKKAFADNPSQALAQAREYFSKKTDAAPTTTPVGKQPWEMTKAEWIEQFRHPSTGAALQAYDAELETLRGLRKHAGIGTLERTLLEAEIWARELQLEHPIIAGDPYGITLAHNAWRKVGRLRQELGMSASESVIDRLKAGAAVREVSIPAKTPKIIASESKTPQVTQGAATPRVFDTDSAPERKLEGIAGDESALDRTPAAGALESKQQILDNWVSSTKGLYTHQIPQEDAFNVVDQLGVGTILTFDKDPHTRTIISQRSVLKDGSVRYTLIAQGYHEDYNVWKSYDSSLVTRESGALTEHFYPVEAGQDLFGEGKPGLKPVVIDSGLPVESMPILQSDAATVMGVKFEKLTSPPTRPIEKPVQAKPSAAEPITGVQTELFPGLLSEVERVKAIYAETPRGRHSKAFHEWVYLTEEKLPAGTDWDSYIEGLARKFNSHDWALMKTLSTEKSAAKVLWDLNSDVGRQAVQGKYEQLPPPPSPEVNVAKFSKASLEQIADSKAPVEQVEKVTKPVPETQRELTLAEQYAAIETTAFEERQQVERERANKIRAIEAENARVKDYIAQHGKMPDDAYQNLGQAPEPVSKPQIAEPEPPTKAAVQEATSGVEPNVISRLVRTVKESVTTAPDDPLSKLVRSWGTSGPLRFVGHEVASEIARIKRGGWQLFTPKDISDIGAQMIGETARAKQEYANALANLEQLKKSIDDMLGFKAPIHPSIGGNRIRVLHLEEVTPKLEASIERPRELTEPTPPTKQSTAASKSEEVGMSNYQLQKSYDETFNEARQDADAFLAKYSDVISDPENIPRAVREVALWKHSQPAKAAAPPSEQAKVTEPVDRDASPDVELAKDEVVTEGGYNKIKLNKSTVGIQPNGEIGGIKSDDAHLISNVTHAQDSITVKLLTIEKDEQGGLARIAERGPANIKPGDMIDVTLRDSTLSRFIKAKKGVGDFVIVPNIYELTPTSGFEEVQFYLHPDNGYALMDKVESYMRDKGYILIGANKDSAPLFYRPSADWPLERVLKTMYGEFWRTASVDDFVKRMQLWLTPYTSLDELQLDHFIAEHQARAADVGLSRDIKKNLNSYKQRSGNAKQLLDEHNSIKPITALILDEPHKMGVIGKVLDGYTIMSKTLGDIISILVGNKAGDVPNYKAWVMGGVFHGDNLPPKGVHLPIGGKTSFQTEADSVFEMFRKRYKASNTVSLILDGTAEKLGNYKRLRGVRKLADGVYEMTIDPKYVGIQTIGHQRGYANWSAQGAAVAMLPDDISDIALWANRKVIASLEQGLGNKSVTQADKELLSVVKHPDVITTTADQFLSLGGSAASPPLNNWLSKILGSRYADAITVSMKPGDAPIMQPAVRYDERSPNLMVLGEVDAYTTSDLATKQSIKVDIDGIILPIKAHSEGGHQVGDMVLAARSPIVGRGGTQTLRVQGFHPEWKGNVVTVHPKLVLDNFQGDFDWDKLAYRKVQDNADDMLLAAWYSPKEITDTFISYARSKGFNDAADRMALLAQQGNTNEYIPITAETPDTVKDTKIVGPYIEGSPYNVGKVGINSEALKKTIADRISSKGLLAVYVNHLARSDYLIGNEKAVRIIGKGKPPIDIDYTQGDLVTQRQNLMNGIQASADSIPLGLSHEEGWVHVMGTYHPDMPKASEYKKLGYHELSQDEWTGMRDFYRDRFIPSVEVANALRASDINGIYDALDNWNKSSTIAAGHKVPLGEEGTELIVVSNNTKHYYDHLAAAFDMDKFVLDPKLSGYNTKVSVIDTVVGDKPEKVSKSWVAHHNANEQLRTSTLDEKSIFYSGRTKGQLGLDQLWRRIFPEGRLSTAMEDIHPLTPPFHPNRWDKYYGRLIDEALYHYEHGTLDAFLYYGNSFMRDESRAANRVRQHSYNLLSPGLREEYANVPSELWGQVDDFFKRYNEHFKKSVVDAYKEGGEVPAQKFDVITPDPVLPADLSQFYNLVGEGSPRAELLQKEGIKVPQAMQAKAKRWLNSYRKQLSQPPGTAGGVKSEEWVPHALTYINNQLQNIDKHPAVLEAAKGTQQPWQEYFVGKRTKRAAAWAEDYAERHDRLTNAFKWLVDKFDYASATAKGGMVLSSPFQWMSFWSNFGQVGLATGIDTSFKYLASMAMPTRWLPENSTVVQLRRMIRGDPTLKILTDTGITWDGMKLLREFDSNVHGRLGTGAWELSYSDVLQASKSLDVIRIRDLLTKHPYLKNYLDRANSILENIKNDRGWGTNETLRSQAIEKYTEAINDYVDTLNGEKLAKDLKEIIRPPEVQAYMKKRLLSDSQIEMLSSSDHKLPGRMTKTMVERLGKLLGDDVDTGNLPKWVRRYRQSPLSFADPTNVLYTLNRHLASAIDINAKGVIYIDLIKKGYQPREAAIIANKYLIDYTDLSPLGKVAARTIPFYNWNSKILKLYINLLATQPHQFRRIMLLLDAFDTDIDEKGGVSLPFPDLQKEGWGWTPKKGWRLPFLEEPARINAYGKALHDTLTDNHLALIEQVLQDFNPMMIAGGGVKTVAEMAAHRDFYLDRSNRGTRRMYGVFDRLYSVSSIRKLFDIRKETNRYIVIDKENVSQFRLAAYLAGVYGASGTQRLSRLYDVSGKGGKYFTPKGKLRKPRKEDWDNILVYMLIGYRDETARDVDQEMLRRMGF